MQPAVQVRGNMGHPHSGPTAMSHLFGTMGAYPTYRQSALHVVEPPYLVHGARNEKYLEDAINRARWYDFTIWEMPCDARLHRTPLFPIMSQLLILSRGFHTSSTSSSSRGKRLG
jgi:hypothetical protein